MNEQLTVKKLRELLKGMPDNDIIYLGDDEELNGIHEAWYCQEINADEASAYSYGSLTEKGVMIS